MEGASAASTAAPTAADCVNLYTDCCRLVNEKKEKFYNVTRNLSLFQEKYPQFRTGFFTDNFDWSDRSGCCNVIAISLYFLNCNIGTLEKYLLSIQRSIKNIETNLPTWVIRVYFSSSVFDCMAPPAAEVPTVTDERHTNVREAYEIICNHEQVELYRYEESIFEGLPIEHSRTLRFLPLIDPEVNVCNVREADGIVTLLDCHNMKIFAASPDHLFYLPDHGEINRIQLMHQNEELRQLFSSYAGWLSIYKCILNRNYFLYNQNVYDLVAGLFGTKIKPKPEYYTITIKNLNGQIRSIEDFHRLYKNIKDERISTGGSPPLFGDIIRDIEDRLPNSTTIFKPPESKIHATIMISHEVRYDLTPEKFITQFVSKNFKKALEVGFDEILLLDLFKNFISVDITQSYETPSYNGMMFGLIRRTPQISESILNVQKYIISDNILKVVVPVSKSIMQNYVPVVIKTIRNNLNLILRNYGIEATNIRNYKIESIRLFQFNPNNIYDLLYLIDSLLTDINFTKAFNITVQINGENWKLNEILNVPYLSRYNILYDSPLASSDGGGKRHTTQSLRTKRTKRTKWTKRTNRRKEHSYRSYRSKKTSQKRRHKKTYKYKNHSISNFTQHGI